MSGSQESQKLEFARSANLHTGTDQKRCFKCREIKLLSEFHKHPKTADGRLNKCKKCASNDTQKWQKVNPEKTKENHRRWRAMNLEKLREIGKNWREANLERAKEKSRKWQQNNPEKAKENCRKWHKANPEKVKECYQKWVKANPEKVITKNRNKRAQKKNAKGLHTENDINKIFARQGGQCNACGKKLTRYRKKQYHVDHIIPLAKGGSNWPDNIQLLCPHCNKSKQAKDPIEWARENGRLF